MTLAERLRAYLAPARRRSWLDAATSASVDDDPDVKLRAIAFLAGHRPSGLADAFGGYLCACQQSSWSHHASFGPYGGCAQGWFDARAFLRRYGVPDELRLEDRG